MQQVQQTSSVERAVMLSLHDTLNRNRVLGSDYDYIMSDLEPGNYSSAEAFKRDYALWSLLRKWKGFKVAEVNQTKAALATWMTSEKKCFSTNRLLEVQAATGLYSVAPSAITAAQRKVRLILGEIDYEKISELCRFGPGATYDKRRGSTHAEKTRQATVTFDALPTVCRVLAHDRHQARLIGPLRDLKVVSANRMVMVPKTAKTHRTISAEPTLNGYVQQGIGRYIRMRLKRFGVDLDDQTINQDLARRAQVENLATLDLSAASDTLCLNLVKLLLPQEWFELLASVRSPATQWKGKRFILSKFSSMGNAYTFELESMIFYALCTAVAEHEVSVYGDDIVCSQSDDLAVRAMLVWAGFKINEDKSYGEGSRFFESCGKHYFDGMEVTPCYQKDVCRTPHDFVRLHNRLVRAGIRLGLREEFNAAANIVQVWSRRIFGRRSPGVGPNVEYDEYFIKEAYEWGSDRCDSVRIRSVVSRAPAIPRRSVRYNLTAYAQKLRTLGPSRMPQNGFLEDYVTSNVLRNGHVGTTPKAKLLVTEKYHWRSATFG